MEVFEPLQPFDQTRFGVTQCGHIVGELRKARMADKRRLLIREVRRHRFRQRTTDTRGLSAGGLRTAHHALRDDIAKQAREIFRRIPAQIAQQGGQHVGELGLALDAHVLEHGGLPARGVIAGSGRERHDNGHSRFDIRRGAVTRPAASTCNVIDMGARSKRATRPAKGRNVSCAQGSWRSRWLSASSSGCISTSGNEDGDEVAVEDMR